MKNTLKIFDVKWTSFTAGPSPDDNKRTELFLMGCEMAASGHPCKNCFNQRLWKSPEGATERTPKEVAENIKRFAPNKFLTIVGGEPLDQLRGLAELCELLTEDGFHIIVFTHYEMETIALLAANGSEEHQKLLSNVDILVDGQYDESQRIYDESAEDGFHDAIGSGNQVVWDLREWRQSGKTKEIDGIKAGDLVGLYVTPDYSLRYITKSEEAEMVSSRLAG